MASLFNNHFKSAYSFNLQLKKISFSNTLLLSYSTWLISFLDTPNSNAILDDFICFIERRPLILSSKVGSD